MSVQVQFRRGNTAQTAAFTGAYAEITVDTQKKTAVIHDGSTAGGTPLAREYVANLAFDQANSAYNAANSVTGSGYSYSNTIGAASNSWTNTVFGYSNSYTQTVGTAGNNYTVSVGAASNGWANTVVAGANAWSNTKVSSVTGTAGQIYSSGGTTPTLNLIQTGVTTSTYGGASQIPVKIGRAHV